MLPPLPIAGPKGSGLSIMLECLTSIMVGFPKLEPVLLGKERPFGLQGVAGNPDQIRRHIQNSTMAAIDIGRFTDVDQYKEHIDHLIDGLKSLPRADGFDEILAPGELEDEIFAQRSRNGTPTPQDGFATASGWRKAEYPNIGGAINRRPLKAPHIKRIFHIFQNHHPDSPASFQKPL